MIVFKTPKYRKRLRRGIAHNPKIYLRTPRIKAHREIPYSKIFIFTLIVIILGGILYLIFFSGFFAIKKIIVLNNKNISQKQVEEVIGPIRFSPMVFNNTLFFKSGEAQVQLLDKFKTLRGVQISKKLPSTLRISLEERSPSLIWQVNDKKYLVDDQGIIFTEFRPDMQIGSNLPTVTDLTKQETGIDKKVASLSFISFIQQLFNQTPQKVGTEIDAINIIETPFEVEVRIKEGYRVFFDTNGDVDLQISNLVRVLEDSKQKGISPENVDYIDLRLKDKIFYKYK
jgi:cell division septal protein FtsQ